MFRVLFLCLLITVSVSAQTTHKYFIRFTDKNGSAFSVNDPASFLSPKAIARRDKQNIPVIEEDLPVNSSYIDNVIATGATILTRSKWFNGVTIECDSAVLSSVLSLPFVVSSTNVFRLGFTGQPKKLSNGLPLSSSPMMRTSAFTYGDSYNQIHLMNGEFLHDAGYTGQGMLIAVLDAGFYHVDQLSVFESLRNQNNIVATWDFVSGDSSVYEDATHGMSVLSTIAGNAPGSLIGTAPQSSFLLLRSEDEGSENIIEEYNWNAAAEYADSAGADVISSSLGYTTFDNPSDDHTYADMDGDHCPSSIAADIAASKGILVINSAGNSGSNSWHYIGAPSDGDSVISIGAVDSTGNYIYFSSYGPSYDGDVKPNVAAKGFQSTIANQFGGISKGNGTSFACPILAGSATCLWQAFPFAPVMQIKEAIERSANCYRAPNDSLGYGIPDFRIARYFLSNGNFNLPATDEVLGVYPNPFSETINIRFYSATTQNIDVELINSIGQKMGNVSTNISGGYINTISINPNPVLASGIYFIRIVTGEKTFVERVVRY